MSVEGKAKEAAGFVKEEIYEHGKSPESQKKAQEGRDLRNEGRIEDGKPPNWSHEQRWRQAMSRMRPEDDAALRSSASASSAAASSMPARASAGVTEAASDPRPNWRDRAFVVRTYDFGEADRVVVLVAGRMVAAGPWEQLRDRWGHLAG